MPKLSILTTCYNHKQYLRESLESSLASDADIEVIFVDDGSTDGSWLVAREIQEHDPRLTTVRVRQNRGLAGALNLAIRHSTSPWLLKIDADDKCDPRYPEAIINAAEMMPQLNVIYSPARLFGLENYDYRYKDFDPKKMIDEFLIPGPSAFRYELWRAVGGFDEAMLYGEDWDFFVRAQLAVGLRTMQFNTPMWYYRQHNGERASTLGKRNIDALKEHMRSHTRESVERKAWEMREMHGTDRGIPRGIFRGNQ
jgi:glycosyltransferase involved in cell wall biosynthesis